MPTEQHRWRSVQNQRWRRGHAELWAFPGVTVRLDRAACDLYVFV